MSMNESNGIPALRQVDNHQAIATVAVGIRLARFARGHHISRAPESQRRQEAGSRFWKSSGDVGGVDLLYLSSLIRVECVPQIDCLLEIEPELRLSAGELTKPERSIRGHGPLPVHDLVHPRIRNSKGPRSVFLCDSKRDQEVLEEDLTGMGRTTIFWQTTHGFSLNLLLNSRPQ